MNRAIKIALASVYALVVLAVAYEIARWTARREIARAKPTQQPQPQHEAWTLVKRTEEA